MRWTRLFRPVPGVLALLTLICVPALLLMFYKGWEDTAAAYPLHVVGAYTLAAWAARVPGAVRRGKAVVFRFRLGRRCLTDLHFRARLSLLLSAGINAVYALFKLGAGIYYRSLWFGAIAVYYLILAAARGLLAQRAMTGRGGKAYEYRAARLCGYLLLLLNIALSAVTLQMVRDGRGYRYPGYLIFAAALYAFYAVGSAVAGLLRFRKLDSPVLSASKVLSLATALVSMLSLQTAMFDAFGDGLTYQRNMNAGVGGAVCLTIFVMAIFMVVQSSRRLKALCCEERPCGKEMQDGSAK